MAGIMCCWANVNKEAAEWYEEEWVPRMRNPNIVHSIHCEVTASGMENEPVGKLDSPWPYMTLYEVSNIDQANKDMVEKTYSLPDNVLAGALKESRFDVRTYREVKRWQDEEWEGEGGSDIEHVASVAAMEWRIPADKEEEVLKYYMEVVGPTIASSPDVLRFRLFTVDRATSIQGSSYVEKDSKLLHKYFTLVELESEEWPWDVVVELAEDENWKNYFDTQAVVKWQLSHYLVTQANHKNNAKSPVHE
ncbi:hypothetical protein P3342_005971 [Pyrenophora teres f. teres]|nr:hypothetical protein P3342_005971 [Pyrenophora teres f. teres]